MRPYDVFILRQFPMCCTIFRSRPSLHFLDCCHRDVSSAPLLNARRSHFLLSRLIPLAIVGSTHFESTLVNFLAVLGYYASPFSAIVLVEHIVFRKSSPETYDVTAWNSLRRLPTGWPAMAAFACSFGLTVPCMDQVWYVGPIASKGTGDIGFEVSFFAGALLYFVFRNIDLRITGGRLGGSP